MITLVKDSITVEVEIKTLALASNDDRWWGRYDVIVTFPSGRRWDTTLEEVREAHWEALKKAMDIWDVRSPQYKKGRRVLKRIQKKVERARDLVREGRL